MILVGKDVYRCDRCSAWGVIAYVAEHEGLPHEPCPICGESFAVGPGLASHLGWHVRWERELVIARVTKTLEDNSTHEEKL